MNRFLAIFVALCFCAPVLAQGQRTVTFEDLDGVKSGESFVGVSLDLSPQGRQIACEFGRRLKIFDARTGRVLHDLGEGILPAFSRTGERLAFYSTRSGAMQLWLWEAKDGSLRQLTKFPQGVDPDPTTRVMGYVIDAYRIDWSPDGHTLAFASRAVYPDTRKPGEPLVLDNQTAVDLTLSGVFAQPGVGQGGVAYSRDGRRFEARPAPPPGERLLSRIFLIDLVSGDVKELPSGAGHTFHPAFSPDGQRIAYAAIPENESVTSAGEGEIRVLELPTGQEKVLAAGNRFKHRPRWSPDGSQMAYLSGGYATHPQIEIVRTNDGTSVHHYAFGKLIWKYEWDRRGDGLLVAYSDDGPKLARLPFAQGALKTMYEDVGTWWAQSEAGSLAWVEGHGGPGVFTAASHGAKPKKVLDLQPRAQEALKLGRIEDIPYRTKRGDDLQGKLLYPPDYTAGKKYPLILDTYPINSGLMWMHPMYGNEALAAMGYMVFLANQARAPHVIANCSGREDYCAGSKGPQAWDVMVDDVMSGVDELIRRGLVDGDRMCIFGHSNGGGVADYLITRTDRFKCAVSAAPVWPNWVGAPLLTGWWSAMEEYTGVSPLDNPEAYIKLSAVFHTRNVKTPVLMFVGDRDGGFLLGAIEMYNSLRYAGVPVTLVRYPDQGHIFEGEALRDFWTRITGFFGRYLTPER